MTTIPRPTTPDQLIRRREYDTVAKSRFFQAFDKSSETSITDALRELQRATGLEPSRRTVQGWIAARKANGESACRRSRPQSQSLGRKRKLSQDQLEDILNPETNPWREQRYAVQSVKLGLGVHERTIERNLFVRCDGAKKFIAAATEELSPDNIAARKRFGRHHEKSTVQNFCQYLILTDECAIDPSESRKKRIPRRPGTRYLAQNIVRRPKKKGSKIRCAAWVSYHSKAPELIFYHEEKPRFDLKSCYPARPRKGKFESPDAHHQRILEWEAKKPPDPSVETNNKKNLTQERYVDEVLPHYIRAFHQTRKRYGKAFLLEDGDGSHGRARSDSFAAQAKEKAGILVVNHPAQSPDLNPIESIWGIVKQRLRSVEYIDMEDLKQQANREWKKITQKEIQERIKDLPRRYRLLAKGDGQRIRNSLW